MEDKNRHYFFLTLKGREMGGSLAKLAARLLATAALWVQIQTYLKDTKWAT